MAQGNTSFSPSSPADQALETTMVSGSSLSLTLAVMDTQLGRLPESRKRSRDTDSEDSMDEEPQSRRARTGRYSPHQHERRNGPSTSAVRRPMTARRGRPFSFPLGRRTTHCEEQEHISNAYVNTEILTTPAPGISLADVHREATPSPSEPTTRKRAHEEISDTSDESSENERSAKVTRKSGRQASTRNRKPRSRVRAAGVSHRFPNHEMRNRLPSQTQNEMEKEVLITPYAVENHDSEAESSPALSELSAAEAPSPENDESGIERPVVVELTSDERKAIFDAEWEADYRLFHQYDDILPPRTPSPGYSSPDSDGPSSPQMPGSNPPSSPQISDIDVLRRKRLSRTNLDPSSSSEVSSDEEVEELPAPLVEQRSQPFLAEPSRHFEMLLHEVETQKMYLCARERWDHDGREDRFGVIGTTGNIYLVEIGKNPSCNCFEGLRGNICKHVVFVLVKVLMLEAPLRHQVAFLSSEVERMLDVIIIDDYCEQKPVENCPICMDKIGKNGHGITWCKTQCGVNYHHSCLLAWATTNWAGKERVEDPTIIIKCATCRAPWIFTTAELISVIDDAESADYDGDYYNVSKILGMKGPGLSKSEEEEYQRFVQEAGGRMLRPRIRTSEETMDDPRRNPSFDRDEDNDEDGTGRST